MTTRHSYRIQYGDYSDEPYQSRVAIVVARDASEARLAVGQIVCPCDPALGEAMIEDLVPISRAVVAETRVRWHAAPEPISRAVVAEARARNRLGESVVDIARHYEVRYHALLRAVRGRTWRCVDAVESPVPGRSRR